MKSYFGRASSCTDRESLEYIHINNFGMYENIDTVLAVDRKNGRQDYQILVILDGEGYFMQDGKFIKQVKNCCILYRPSQPQSYYFAVGSSYFWIHFTGKEVNALLARMGFSQMLYTVSDIDSVVRISEKMQTCVACPDNTTEDMLNCHFINLLSVLISNKSHKGEGVSRAFGSMRNASFGELSIKDYADIAGMSQYHFIRCFKSKYGLTPLKYKSRLIAEKAADLLLNTNLSISEIADILGFEDSLYFSRFFRKNMGESPGCYREKH